MTIKKNVKKIPLAFAVVALINLSACSTQIVLESNDPSAKVEMPKNDETYDYIVKHLLDYDIKDDETLLVEKLPAEKRGDYIARILLLPPALLIDTLFVIGMVGAAMSGSPMPSYTPIDTAQTPQPALAPANSGTSLSAYQSGNSVFYSDGSTAQRIGNSTIHSDGSRSHTVGDSTFHSDGTRTMKVGDNYINSDGTRCSKIGSQMVCR